MRMKPSVTRHTIVIVHRLMRTGELLKSKLPRGKKSTKIPPVAASERGGAQSLNQHVLVEASGKARDTGVTARTQKRMCCELDE